MTTFPWLTVLAVLPLIGALALVFIKGSLARTVGLAFSLVTLVVSIVVAVGFQPGNGMQYVEQQSWIPAIGASYSLGVDGMGLLMVLLTTILVPVVLIAVWDDPDANEGRWTSQTFFGLALLLEGLSLYVFMATDVLLFYLFFEATLIPMYFLIGGFGGHKRNAAAMKFLLFSLAGGLVMLFAVIGVYGITAGAGQPSFLIDDFASIPMSETVQKVLFAGFFIAFAVKAPMVPVHTWLPDTAEQALPGATALLVGILDKIGTFGMIRICLGMLPGASLWATPFVVVLAVISIIYGAVLAITSTNLLRLVAYTSVSHFGFMVLGIFAFTTTAMSGSIFYMLAHGFSSAALFLAVGFLLNRRGSVEIADFGGVQQLAPLLAGVFLISGLATLGLPGTANFVGEFSIMTGSWQRQTAAVVIAVLGTVLAAVYVLWAYQRVFTGQPTDAVKQSVTSDLGGREKLVIGPLIALLLLFGFYPQPMINVVEQTASTTMNVVGMTDPLPGSMGGK